VFSIQGGGMAEILWRLKITAASWMVETGG
jgi:hypothetical protein